MPRGAVGHLPPPPRTYSVKQINASAYRPLAASETQKINDSLKHDIISCVFISGCERCTAYAKEITVRLVLVFGLIVAAAYRPVVVRMSLISFVLNADSGR